MSSDMVRGDLRSPRTYTVLYSSLTNTCFTNFFTGVFRFHKHFCISRVTIVFCGHLLFIFYRWWVPEATYMGYCIWNVQSRTLLNLDFYIFGIMQLLFYFAHQLMPYILEKISNLLSTASVFDVFLP
jgi:hypothetical protein